MPIRHGLPTLEAAEDTPEAIPRATPTGDDTTTERRKDDDSLKPWPTTLALEQIKWLSNRLDHPTIPAAVFEPDATLRPAADYCDSGGLTLPYARARVLAKNTPPHLLDRVWRFIIEAARVKKGDWNLFALGMGVNGLQKAASKLAHWEDHSVPYIWTVNQFLAAEFLQRIHGYDEHLLDIDRPRIYLRLRDQCVYAAKGDWRQAAQDRRSLVEYDAYCIGAAEAGGLVFERVANDIRAYQLYPGADAFTALLRLVRRKKISEQDAALIGYTSVAGFTVAEAGARLGMTPSTARGRHHRAKDLIGRTLDPTGRYRPTPTPGAATA